MADAHGIPVIEDCAQAFLATQDGRLVGTIGAIGAFSLQQGKHMTTGEGGIVITADAAYARWMTLFSDKAWGYGDPKPDHYFLALNYRMTDLQGAVARAQLAKLDGVVARRQRTAARAHRSCSPDVAGLTLPDAARRRDARLLEVPADRRSRGASPAAPTRSARALKAPASSARRATSRSRPSSARSSRERKTFGKSQCPVLLPRARRTAPRSSTTPPTIPDTMRGPRARRRAAVERVLHRASTSTSSPTPCRTRSPARGRGRVKAVGASA